MMSNRFLAFAAITALLAVPANSASAMGTVQVRQSDGSSKTYKSVTVKMNAANIAVTSGDREGTLVIGKDACAQVGAVMRCLPYDAVLTQYGNLYHIAVKSGTLWVNPTQKQQTVPSASATLPPRGVLLKMQTKAGTSVALTGTVDEMEK